MSGHTCAHTGICTHARCAGKCPFHYLTPALPRYEDEAEQEHPLIEALRQCIEVMNELETKQ